MFKTKQKLLNISLFLAAVMLLSACGGNIIKPIRKDLLGHSTVRNITVIALPSAGSDTIASKVKTAVRSEANDELKGKIQVDLKIMLDQWTGKEKVLGGSFTNTLFGSKTVLSGTVEILDTNTGSLLGKYKIYSKHEEGGLLSKTTTISLVDTDAAVINRFAEWTIDQIQ